jgi:hypothetical protein
VGEVAQILDDVPDALRALLRLADRLGQVREHEADVRLFGRVRQGLRSAGDLVEIARLQRPLQALHPGPHLAQVAHVLRHLEQVGVDEAHGVVDLVGDPRGQLTDRRELLGAYELALRARELVERLGELAVLAREVGGTHLDGALEVEVDFLRRAQLVAERAAHLLERECQAADLVALAAGRDRIGELAARHRIGALLEAFDR